MAKTKGFNILHNLIVIATKISQISAFHSLIKTQSFDLSRRITFLIPLFQHLANDVVFVPYETLVSLQEALLSAKDLLRFCSSSSQLYMILERKKVKCRFTDLASHFEQAINEISYDKLDISEELKEQIALVVAQFRRAKEHFYPPGLELYEHLLSIYNQNCDVTTESDALRLICEKLQFVSAEDIEKESLALHKVIVDGGGYYEKSLQGLPMVLRKIEDFLLKDSENKEDGCFEKSTQVLSSGDFPPHTNYPCVKLCCQSPVVPEEFRCPIPLRRSPSPSGHHHTRRTSLPLYCKAGLFF